MHNVFSIADKDTLENLEKMHYTFNYGSLQPCLKLCFEYTRREWCHT